MQPKNLKISTSFVADKSREIWMHYCFEVEKYSDFVIKKKPQFHSPLSLSLSLSLFAEQGLQQTDTEII